METGVALNGDVSPVWTTQDGCPTTFGLDGECRPLFAWVFAPTNWWTQLESWTLAWHTTGEKGNSQQGAKCATETVGSKKRFVGFLAALATATN